MTWAITDDAAHFLARAGGVLTRDPVMHTPLLTEAAYLASRPQPGAAFGVWDGDEPAAFVHVPRHPVLVSTLPVDPDPLLDGLPGLPWDVGAADADAVLRAMSLRGVQARTGGTIALLRLDDDAALDASRIDADGIARTATAADRPLLERWYSTLLSRLDDDATDLAFLVDEPLSYGGTTLWEHAGGPVGVAVRTRAPEGVTKVTAAWSPEDDRYAEAAFVSACAAARAAATDVVAVARAGSPAEAAYRALGFSGTGERALVIEG